MNLNVTKKVRSRITSIILVITMVTGVFSMTDTTVYGRERVNQDNLPEKSLLFLDELKKVNAYDRDGEIADVRVHFGNNKHTWTVAGQDTLSNCKENLVLVAATKVGRNRFASHYKEIKRNSKLWADCIYPEGVEIKHVGATHYGASYARQDLKNLEKTYFTEEEQKLMNVTDVRTVDSENDKVYVTKDKLYLPYGYQNWFDEFFLVGNVFPQNDVSDDQINNDDLKGLRVEKRFFPEYSYTRRPRNRRYPDNTDRGYLYGKMSEGTTISSAATADTFFNLMPAFELNATSVLFGSYVPAIEKEGLTETEYATNREGMAMTLRYDAKNTLGSAKVSFDSKEVEYKDVPKGTYLVCQNDSMLLGARAKLIEGTGTIKEGELKVYPGDTVWLEKTDTDGRITYATIASRETGTKVNIKAGLGVSIDPNEARQEVAPNSPINDILIVTEKGYYFPEDYLNQLQALELYGLAVSKVENGYRIYGTPTSDVEVVLPSAIAKTTPSAPDVKGEIGNSIRQTDSTMEYAAFSDAVNWIPCTDEFTKTGTGTWYVRYRETTTQNPSLATKVIVIPPNYTITTSEKEVKFDNKNEGYDDSNLSKTVVIKNEGNCDVDLKDLVSSSYNVIVSKKHLIPNETCTLIISPKKNLMVGEYKETIDVMAEQGTSAQVKVNFKVNGKLTVGLVASATNIIEGQSVDLTATAKGGSGNYSYKWYAGDKYLADLSGAKVNVSPSVTTTYKVVITDTIENKDTVATITVIPRKYVLTVPSSFTFDSKHIGYESIDANEFTIKNDGNVEITNVKVELIGENSEAFVLEMVKPGSTILPKEVKNFFVKPKDDLSAGKYKTEIKITGDVGISEVIKVELLVEDHKYSATITKPACTEKGYTTHKCTVCGYNYIDSEVASLNHDFGEWTITKEATTFAEGEKVRKCTRCGLEEKCNIPMLEKDNVVNDKTDKVNKGNDKVQTGDVTDYKIYIFTALASAILITALSLMKKRKQ